MNKLNEFSINKSDTIWATGVGKAVAFPCENGTLVLQMANLSIESWNPKAESIVYHTLKPWSWIWNPTEPKSTIYYPYTGCFLIRPQSTNSWIISTYPAETWVHANNLLPSQSRERKMLKFVPNTGAYVPPILCRRWWWNP